MSEEKPYSPINWLDTTLPFATEYIDNVWKLTGWISHVRMTLEIFVCEPGASGNTLRVKVKQPDGRIELRPQAIWRRYHFEPGVEVRIPAAHDRQVQALQCFHTSCLRHPLDCTSDSEGHEKTIVGGLGPHLRRVGSPTPRIHPSIKDEPPEEAPQPRLLESLSPKPVITPELAAMARSRARRAAAAGAK